MPGPAPKPTTIKLAQGNPGKRPLNKAEPDPKGPPILPAWLGKGESGKRRKATWRRLVPRLQQCGLATVADSEPLARYVDLLCQWVDVRQFLEENGYTYIVRGAPSASEVELAKSEGREPAGEPREVRPWPQVALFNRITAELRQLEDRFGMTPSARSRIKVDPGKAVNTGLSLAQQKILAG